MDFIGNVIKDQEEGLIVVKLVKRGSNETRIPAREIFTGALESTPGFRDAMFGCGVIF